MSAEHNTERWDWVGLISYSIAHCIVICEILTNTIPNQANLFRQSLNIVQEMPDSDFIRFLYLFMKFNEKSYSK